MLQKERERKKHLFVLYKKGKGGFIYRSPILPQGCSTRVSSSSLLLELGFLQPPFSLRVSKLLLSSLTQQRSQDFRVCVFCFQYSTSYLKDLGLGFFLQWLLWHLNGRKTRWSIVKVRLQWHEGYSESRQHSHQKQLDSEPTRLIFAGLFQTLYLIHN